MNKFFSILLFALISVTVHAQIRKFNPISFNLENNKQNRSITDTLMPQSYIDTASGGTGCPTENYSVDITNPVDSGYVSGTNIFGDLEKGQRYLLSDFGYDTISINKFIAHFSIIHQNGSIGLVVGKIYSLNTQGFPDSLIAVSTPVSISSISVIINGIAEFDFPSTLTLTNGFIVAVDFSSCLTDTIALVQTAMNCFDQHGGSLEKWSDSSWHTIQNSWSFETDLSLFPILNDGVQSGIQPTVFHNESGAFPNPANNIVTVQFNKSINVIAIYNSIGIMVFQIENINSNSFKIDATDFPNGIYYLSAIGNATNFNQQIIVLHN